MSCRPLSPEESIATLTDAALRSVNTYDLMSACDTDISRHSGELRKRDRLAANLIDAINKKLDTVVQHLEVERNTLKGITHKLQEVNISACGLAFVRDKSLLPDTLVCLNLQLQPSNQEIVSCGKVVGCEPCVGGFYVRINFEQMALEDQEDLIHHLMQRQKVQLRKT
jgi:hypothetical protein